MSVLTTQQVLELALQHHRAGRLVNAENLYRQVLVHQPNHADAMHLLGLLAHHAGRSDAAIDLIRGAIRLGLDNPEVHCNLGDALRTAGQLDQAITSFQRAISLNPSLAGAYINLGIAFKEKGLLDQSIRNWQRAIELDAAIPEAHANLGIALHQNGQIGRAIDALRRAITLRPNYAEAYTNLGSALKSAGQLDDAVLACGRAVELNPDSFQAHANLAEVLNEKREFDQAIEAYQRAIALRPRSAELHNNLGNVFSAAGRFDDAIASYQKAIGLQGDYYQAHNNLGSALAEKGLSDHAIAAYERSIAIKSDYAEAHCNLGAMLRDKGKLDDAIQSIDRAIAIRPESADAHWSLAGTRLLNGDFEIGWKEYEWRWKLKNFPSPYREFVQPQWDGSYLGKRTILLHIEQGFGDAIQFLRYVPMVAGRGGRIVLETPPELQRLLQCQSFDWQIVARGEPLPPFDVHCPLLSLPLLFGTTLDSVPAQVPYLHADHQLRSYWHKQLESLPESRKVGLVWSGNPAFKNDKTRSPRHLSLLAPLAQAKNTFFVSLQKGYAAQQTNNPPAGMHLIDPSGQLYDFADTAALIANLDLIISSDTSIAHLAGAMGKPVWVMLPFAPDWRWLLTRHDSPWYPTMRLFRQAAPGDWDSLLKQISDAL